MSAILSSSPAGRKGRVRGTLPISGLRRILKSSVSPGRVGFLIQLDARDLHPSPRSSPHFRDTRIHGRLCRLSMVALPQWRLPPRRLSLDHHCCRIHRRSSRLSPSRPLRRNSHLATKLAKPPPPGWQDNRRWTSRRLACRRNRQTPQADSHPHRRSLHRPPLHRHSHRPHRLLPRWSC